ncbi:gastrula zinc finger protein XlCGF8.2DB-like [Folsomia candida]|uniref:gastrula zinc finger protein XlCGF8.2DB-like n=1 Tax=Folsomia candida TaxID=158441 RepID=UPI000B90964B|nr:gastrula zinc finger protein XlCGF8.2DB-like [Folsomia candida]XP_035712210.1 gastrula zinc finger protein XlCGF8.2DB-like [Folsomia candida]
MDLTPGKKSEYSKFSKTYKTKRNLPQHMAMTDPNAKVKCEVCGILYKNRNTLSSHVSRDHTNRMRPSCVTCDRVFSTLQSFRNHVDTIHSTRERPRFSCTFPGCEKSYLHTGNLAKHVNTEHAANPVRFPCTLCGKDFKRKAHLESHILTHTTEKTYNCSTCGKSFAHRGHIKSHERTHLENSTKRVLKCHLCQQTFSRKDSLKHHVRVVHENQRNFPCTVCDMRFSYLTGLKRHMEARHGTNKERIHSCDKCEYRSHSKHNLANHRLRHSGARHGCDFCGKKFLIFSELVNHCRVHTLENSKYLCI